MTYFSTEPGSQIHDLHDECKSLLRVFLVWILDLLLLHTLYILLYIILYGPGNDRDSRRREFPAPGKGLYPFPAGQNMVIPANNSRPHPRPRRRGRCSVPGPGLGQILPPVVYCYGHIYKYFLLLIIANYEVYAAIEKGTITSS